MQSEGVLLCSLHSVFVPLLNLSARLGGLPCRLPKSRLHLVPILRRVRTVVLPNEGLTHGRGRVGLAESGGQGGSPAGDFVNPGRP